MLKKNKKLQTFIRENKVEMSTKRKRNVASANDNFLNKTSQFKRQRSIIELKSTNLNLYYNKNYKKFKD